MARRVYDTFTDTAGTVLSAHTGEEGAAPWTQTDADPEHVVSDANRLRATSTSSTTAYYGSADLTTNDQDVKFTVYHFTDIDGITAGTLRLTPSPLAYIYGGWQKSGTTHRLLLVKIAGGSATLLGSYAGSLNDNTTYDFHIEARGDVKRLLLNATEYINVTDTDIPSGPRAGVFGSGGSTNTTGTHIDTFEAFDTATASTGLDLTASVGASTLDGHPASFATVTTFAASNAGDSALTGHAAEITTGMVLSPNVGAATLAGHTAALTTGMVLSPSVGAETLDGHAATFAIGVTLNPTVGDAVLGGSAATLTTGMALGASTGDAVLAGYAAAWTEVEWTRRFLAGQTPFMAIAAAPNTIHRALAPNTTFTTHSGAPLQTTAHDRRPRAYTAAAPLLRFDAGDLP